MSPNVDPKPTIKDCLNPFTIPVFIIFTFTIPKSMHNERHSKNPDINNFMVEMDFFFR